MPLLAPWLAARLHLGEKHDECGGPLVEYIFMIGFVLIICMLVIKVTGGRTSEQFSKAAQYVNGCDDPGHHGCAVLP